MANKSGMLYSIAGSAKDTSFVPMLGRYTVSGSAPKTQQMQLAETAEEQSSQIMKVGIGCAVAGALLVWFLFK